MFLNVIINMIESGFSYKFKFYDWEKENVFK